LRHRVRQRSSRVNVLFLLAVASFHRVRHGRSRVAVASRKPLGAAAIYIFGAAAAFIFIFFKFFF
jgi:hypothetical protein